MSDKDHFGDNSLPILVGIDGSDSSISALRWGMNQARLTGAPLMVVSTWQYPTAMGWGELLPVEIDFKGDTQKILDECIDKVVGDDHGLDITTKVIQGHPAIALVELSRLASHVVVGCRGHGEFVGMLLGSVSEFIATHAHCPVVIIRDNEPASDSPTAL